MGVMLAFGRLSAFHPASPLEMTRAIASAVFMVPYLTPEVSVGLFPLNGPAWSLFFELAANLAYALVGPRLPSRVLCVVCIAAGAGVIAAALGHGTLNLGHRTYEFWVGFPRVVFSFGGGVMLYRLYAAGKLPRLGISPLWCMGAAAVLLLLPAKGASAGLLAAAIVVLAFPLLLIAAVGARPPGPKTSRIFALSGEVSYPLYAVHGPLVVAIMMTGRFWNWPIGPLQPWIGIVIAPVLAVFALWISRVYDQPVRRWLTAWRPDAAIRRRLASEA
jgi:peptidoglycan/LPS O-acetylase OafA/YrhL